MSAHARFDGPFAGLTAAIMGRMNLEAEAEAIEMLAPAPRAHVLVLGFGSGHGIELLLRQSADLSVTGVDPSVAMNRVAAKRNRKATRHGCVRLHQAMAAHVPAPNGTFDGALAVNTLQLCNPMDETAKELARVLKPCARLVSLTHDWAVRRLNISVEDWLVQTGAAFGDAGFQDITKGRGKAEEGRIVAFSATRG